MKKYLAILSVPYADRIEASKHIARAMHNSSKPISRSRFFTLYIVSANKKHKDYRVCRIITDKDIENSIYCEESRDDWLNHIELQTIRVREWLKRKSTKVMENNQTTLEMLK